MFTTDVDITVTDADVDASIAGLDTARAAIKSYLIQSLTPDQRQAIFKMGRDSLEYVQENYNYGQDPDTLSSTVDPVAWNNNITANSQFRKIFNVLEPLYFDVFDMMMIVGSQAMEEAQANYRFLRFQAAEGQPKARGAYEALKALRWNRVSHKEAPPVVGAPSK